MRWGWSTIAVVCVSGVLACSAIPPEQEDQRVWNDVKDSLLREDLQGYLSQFPDGQHAAIVRERLASSIPKLDPLNRMPADGKPTWTSIGDPEFAETLRLVSDLSAKGITVNADKRSDDGSRYLVRQERLFEMTDVDAKTLHVRIRSMTTWQTMEIAEPSMAQQLFESTLVVPLARVEKVEIVPMRVRIEPPEAQGPRLFGLVLECDHSDDCIELHVRKTYMHATRNGNVIAASPLTTNDDEQGFYWRTDELIHYDEVSAKNAQRLLMRAISYAKANP